MAKMNVGVSVGDMLNALDNESDRRGVETFRELPDTLDLDVDGVVDPDAIIDAAIDMGYIHADDAMDGMDPELRDLTDGLRALIEGDRSMAATLLARALSEWPAAGRVVEDVLHGRTHRDRRQCVLALAA